MQTSDISRAATVRRAVFLDRDGVINKMVLHPDFGIIDSPANAEQMTLISGVGAAIASLNKLGLLVIVVSNQPGIAKGKFTPLLLDAMEAKMRADIEAEGGKLDAIYNCLHHPHAVLTQWRAHCSCRKPKSGLLEQAALDWQIDLPRSYMIGDGVSDIMAGQMVGVTTFLISSRKCYVCEALAAHRVRPDYLVEHLGQAAAVIEALETGDRHVAQSFAYTCEVV